MERLLVAWQKAVFFDVQEPADRHDRNRYFARGCDRSRREFPGSGYRKPGGWLGAGSTMSYNSIVDYALWYYYMTGHRRAWDVAMMW